MYGALSTDAACYAPVCHAPHHATPPYINTSLTTQPTRLVHTIVTYHDAAMKLLLSRITPVVSSETKNWSEPAGLKDLTLLDIFTKETQATRDYWTPRPSPKPSWAFS